MEWMIKCRNQPGTAELRQATLPAHTKFLDGFHDETWFSGPMISDDASAATGSFRVIDLPARADAWRYIEGDPYAKAGLFAHIDIERLQPLTRTRQAGYAQREGYEQYIAIGLLPDVAPDSVTGALSDFIAQEDDAILACGLLLDDTGQAATGVLLMLDAPSREAALKVRDADPLKQDERYTNLSIERWRFGHV